MNPNAAIETASSRAQRECLICGNSDKINLLFNLSRPILQCGACRLVFAEPFTGGTKPDNYSESYYRSGIYADYIEDRSAIRKNATRTLERFERYVKGRALLDVGCAAGFFLEAARDQGWIVRGLEFSEYASEYARSELRLPVETGSILSPPTDLPLFDVVTLWDTIEHLDRPDIALSNIHRLLHPQGLFAFSTGDYGSALRKLTGKKWRLFSDPTHNFFFDEQTLKRLLSKTGYEVVSVEREGKWVSLSMILHQSGLPFAKKLHKWMRSKNLNPSLYVNLRDVVTIYAKPVK